MERLKEASISEPLDSRVRKGPWPNVHIVALHTCLVCHIVPLSSEGLYIIAKVIVWSCYLDFMDSENTANTFSVCR